MGACVVSFSNFPCFGYTKARSASDAQFYIFGSCRVSIVIIFLSPRTWTDIPLECTGNSYHENVWNNASEII